MPTDKKKPIIVNDKNDPRLKAYNDSLDWYNKSKNVQNQFSSFIKNDISYEDYISNPILNDAAHFEKKSNKPINFTLASKNNNTTQIIPNYKKPVQPVILEDKPNLEPIKPLGIKPMNTSVEAKLAGDTSATKSNYNKPLYQDFVKTANQDYLGPDYNLEEAYKNLPYNMMQAWAKDPENNHLPDTYKLPNHPTFSNESIYYKPGMKAVKWVNEEPVNIETQNYTGSKALKIQGKPTGYVNIGDGTGRKEIKRNGGWLDGLDNNKFQEGGEFGDYKQAGPVEDSQSEYVGRAGMTGMMKSKIATEANYGNPSALRMVSPNPNKYTFTGEEKDWKGNQASPAGYYGTHFMSSFGNQARPGLQEVNGKMQYFQDPPRNSKENINFSRPEDAEYFAEHYKEVAPMMRGTAPDVTNATEYVKNWYNSPMYSNILKNQIADSGVKNPKRIERVAKRSIKSANKEVNSPFYDVTPNIVDNPEYYGKSIDDYKGGRKINLNRNFVENNRKLVNSLFAHELTHDNLMTVKDREYINKNTPEYNPAIHDEKIYNTLTDPGEVRSQIHSIRQLSGENKIYDPLTQPFKKEYLDKVNESYNQGTKDSENYNQLKRLRKYYSDDQITEMMNTISKSNSNDGKVYAKNGGWLDGLTTNKFQNGGFKGTQVPDATATAKPVVNLNFAVTPAQKQLAAKNKRQAQVDMQVDHPEFYTNPNFLDKKVVKPYSVEDYKKGIKEPGLQTSVDPIDLVGTGFYKAGFKALGIKEMTKDAGKFLTESTPLKNAYKYNPLAFKPDKDAYYRMIGKDGFNDALESGVIRPPQHHYTIAQGMPKEGTEGVIFRDGTPYNKMNFPEYDAAYYNKGYPLDKRWYPRNSEKVNPKTGKTISTRKASRNGYDGPYMAEVKDESGYFMKTDVSSKNTVHVTKEDFPTHADNAKFYKEHWLKGYKEVPKDKKSNTGWLDNLK